MRKLCSRFALLFLFSVSVFLSTAAWAVQQTATLPPTAPAAPALIPQPPAPPAHAPIPQPPAPPAPVPIPQPPAPPAPAPIPQPNIPQHNLPPAITLSGTYFGTFSNIPLMFCFEGNRYAVWCNNQLIEHGTYMINGMQFYARMNTGESVINVIRSLTADRSKMQMTFAINGETSFFQKIQ